MCSPHSMYYFSHATITVFDSSGGYENVKLHNKARNQAENNEFEGILQHLNKFNKELCLYQESFI